MARRPVELPCAVLVGREAQETVDLVLVEQTVDAGVGHHWGSRRLDHR